MCDALSSKNYKVNLITPNLSISNKILSKNFRLKNKIFFFSIFRKPITLTFITRILFALKILINTPGNSNYFFVSRSPLFAIIASLLNKKVIYIRKTVQQIQDKFDYITEMLNLHSFKFVSLESDFDYKKQATLFIPNSL